MWPITPSRRGVYADGGDRGKFGITVETGDANVMVDVVPTGVNIDLSQTGGPVTIEGPACVWLLTADCQGISGVSDPGSKVSGALLEFLFLLRP